jgi:6-phosphogluconolactonase (cycloisomerase 2 family)
MISPEYEVLVGSFGPGVLHFRFETASGTLTGPLAVSASENPSWLIRHPSLPVLYAVNECGSGPDEPGGHATAFSLSSKFEPLTALHRVATEGDHPTYCTATADGRYLCIANYAADGGGALSLVSLTEEGRFERVTRHEPPPSPDRPGAHPERQCSSHVHCVVQSPDCEWLCEVDLGHDQVRSYRYASYDSLAIKLEHTLELPPGSGPRHLLFSKDGRFAWLTLELTGQVMVLAHHHGELHPLQTCNLAPHKFQGDNGGGGLKASPDGRFLYVVNRGDDNHLCVFECELSTGLLTLRQRLSTRGPETRELAIAPGGRHLLLANQGENAIRVFARNPDDGLIGDCLQQIDAHAPASFVFIDRSSLS